MTNIVKTGTVQIAWNDNKPIPNGWQATSAAPTFGNADNWMWDANLNDVRQMTAPERAAAEQSKVYTYAKSLLTADDPISKKEKAVLLVVLDEFNAHATKIKAILDAIDGAATFAAMKTAIAAIADYPQRTAAQIKTSVSGKIDAGQADG